MAKINEMQGVPAHLVYLKSDGKRRHPAHCKFHEGIGKKRICYCKDNREMYLLNCKSAKNCDFYEE